MPPRDAAAGRTTERARALGRSGEDLAAAWYAAAGFEVLARNWRCALGEIDLVCRQGRTLVFCEVKARSSDRYGAPAEAVGRTKQLRLRRLAARFCEETGEHGVELRFDVASVLAGELEVLVAAF